MRRASAILLASLMLVGCGQTEGARFAAAPDPRPPAEGGIGGTGIEMAESRGGIGGTGAAGVLGTVTGFGSIHLNGLRVVFPPSGAVRAPSGMVSEAEIDLGETLEMLGQRRGDGTIEPTAAMFRFPIIGQVEEVNATGTRLSLLGARVIVEQGALVVGEAEEAIRLKAGDWVQVSGLPAQGAIVASRVERLPGPVRSSVMGRVEAGPGPGLIRVNGVSVDYGNSTPPRLGWTVRVSGVVENQRLVPLETVRSLLESADTPLSDVSVEGYLEPREATTGLGIGGFGGAFDPLSRVTALQGSRALFIGSLDGGTFKVRHGLALPNDGTARRALLEAVEDGFAPAGAVETR